MLIPQCVASCDDLARERKNSKEIKRGARIKTKKRGKRQRTESSTSSRRQGPDIKINKKNAHITLSSSML